MKIGILGDGGWGTTLAILLHNKGHLVTLWGAFPGYVASLEKKRINRQFLPGIKIPSTLEISADLEKAIKSKDLIVLAIPSQYMRGILKRIKNYCLKGKVVFLSVAKGIEITTLKRMSEVIIGELGRINLCVLSGPTIADEVAQGVPTAAVAASADKCLAKLVARIFSTERFRVYTNSDVIGVELGGSLKNVIAIACGISDGLGFGTNAKAAILSRGLAEISRLGLKLGAKAKTLWGISGLGDLATTCFSPRSRNRCLGEEIGRGKNLKQALRQMRMVAEGVATTQAAYRLSLKHRVEMPITQEIYRVLYRNKPPKKAVRDLMTRSLKEE